MGRAKARIMAVTANEAIMVLSMSMLLCMARRKRRSGRRFK